MDWATSKLPIQQILKPILWQLLAISYDSTLARDFAFPWPLVTHAVVADGCMDVLAHAHI